MNLDIARGADFLLVSMNIKSSTRTQCRVTSIFLDNKHECAAAPATMTSSLEAREQHDSAVALLWINIGVFGL